MHRTAYSPRQTRAKKALEKAFESLDLYHEDKAHDIEEMPDEFEHARQGYERAVRRAIRAGLTEHPLIKEWIQNRRLLGERDVLRRVKGLEKGVKRPITMKDLQLWGRIRRQAEKFAKEHKKLPTQEQIRKLMYNLKELPKMSRQAFNKMVDRLDLRGYFKD